VNAAWYGAAFYSGVIGAALPLNETLVVNAGSVETITIPNYRIILYSLTWYEKAGGPPPAPPGNEKSASEIFGEYPADIYVPIYPSTSTNYTFASNVLLSYTLLGKTYDMYLNNGYFTVEISPPSQSPQ